jgi:hypothetical protein
MTKRDQIRALAHLPPREAARIVGVNSNYVRTVRWQMANTERLNCSKRERARRKGIKSRDALTALLRAKSEPLYTKVNALLSKGMTYSAIAEKLGLKSRNAVAGIANRLKQRAGL